MYHNTTHTVSWNDGPTPDWGEGCGLVVVRAAVIVALLCAALWRILR